MGKRRVHNRIKERAERELWEWWKRSAGESRGKKRGVLRIERKEGWRASRRDFIEVEERESRGEKREGVL